MPQRNPVAELIQDFVTRLTTVLQENAQVRARAAMLAAFEGGPAPVARKVNPRRRLQGRYIGLLRQFSGKDRQRVRALYSSQGVEAAIARMKQMAARAN